MVTKTHVPTRAQLIRLADDDYDLMKSLEDLFVNKATSIDLADHVANIDNPHDTTYLNLADTVDNSYGGKADYTPAVHPDEVATRLVKQGVRDWYEAGTYVFDDLVAFEGTIYHCISVTSVINEPFSLMNFNPITGIAGTGITFNYRWSTITFGDPGSGMFGITNGMANPTNVIRVSDETQNNVNVSNFWSTVFTGDYLVFIEDTGGAESGVWIVTGVPIDFGDYHEIPVDLVFNVGEPEDNRKGFVSIVQNPLNRLPPGGTTDQHLVKQTNADFATGWEWGNDWKGSWVAGEYNPKNVVTDGNYLMIANKVTTDRPAPQPQGDPFFVYDGLSPTDTILAKTLLVGTEYTAGSPFEILKYRVYTVTNNFYSIFYRVDGGTTIQLLSFTADTTGWNVQNLNGNIVTVGQVLEIGVYVTEPDPTPTIFTLSYNYLLPQNPIAPAVGEINHSTSSAESLRINKTDQNGDQSAQLATMEVGDIIDGGGLRWSVQLITDNGTWIDFTVAPAQQGFPAGIQDFNFETVVATPITTMIDVDYFLSEPNVQPFFDIDGGGRIDTDDALGIDIEIQQVVVSADWDLMAVSGSGGAGGGTFTPTIFEGAGSEGYVPDPITESGRSLRDDGTWLLPANQTDFAAHLADLANPHASSYTNIDDREPQDGKVYGRNTNAWEAAASEADLIATDLVVSDHLADFANPHQTGYLNLEDTVDSVYTAKDDFIPAVTNGEDGTRLVAQGVRDWYQAGTYALDDLVAFEGDVYYCIIPVSGLPFSLTNFTPIVSATGTGTSLQYNWTTIVAGDPGSGNFGITLAIGNASNTVRVSGTTSNSLDANAFWAAVAEGDYVSFVEDGSSPESGVWIASGAAVDLIGYYEIPVTYINNTGEPENAQPGVASIIQNPNNKIPSGGLTGQILAKVSNNNYDMAWSSDLIDHEADTANPHATAYTNLGAQEPQDGKVYGRNTNAWEEAASQTDLGVVAGDLATHEADTANPHSSSYTNLLLREPQDGAVYGRSNNAWEEAASQTDLGVVAGDLATHEADVANPHSSSYNNIDDREPNDVNVYGRQGNLWVAAAHKTSFDSHIGDTGNPHNTSYQNLLVREPQDGKVYGRALNLWEAAASEGDLSAHIGDTANPHVTSYTNLSGREPQDGNLYGRQNNTWVQVQDFVATTFTGPGTTGYVPDPVALATGLSLRDDGTWVLPANQVDFATHTSDLANPHATAYTNLGAQEPQDGKVYGRNTNAWEEAASQADLGVVAGDLSTHVGDLANPHASSYNNINDREPIGGKVYGRASNLWEAVASETDLTGHINDTANPHATTYVNLGSREPQDGKVYGRTLNTWLAVASETDLVATDLTISNHIGDLANPHSSSYDNINLREPQDGNLYGRNMNAWVQVPATFVPTTFTGAGTEGYVPDPVTEQGFVLSDNGTWQESGGAGTTTGDVFPISPSVGDMHYLTIEPVGTYIWYEDTGGSSSQWVMQNGSDSGSGGGFTHTNLRAFDANTIYAPTAGTLSIKVTVVGGGGGGGGAASTAANQTAAGSGGGGGSTAIKSYLISDAGVDGAAIVVGSGSAGASTGIAVDGGTSSFGATAAMDALGGKGGISGTASGASGGRDGGAGGQSSGGTVNTRGDAGGASANSGTNNTNNAFALSGTGGGSMLAGGARGRSATSGGAGGSTGGNYGGGGGGAYGGVSNGSIRTGGAGGDGVVIIEEYIS